MQSYPHLGELVLRVVDVSMVGVAAWIAYFWRFDTVHVAANYQIAMLIAVMIVLLVFPLFGLYQPLRVQSALQQVGSLTAAGMVVVSIIVALAFVTKTSELFSRQWFFMSTGLGFVALLSARVIFVICLGVLHRKGYNHVRIALVGGGDLAQEIYRRLVKSPWLGLDVVRIFDDRSDVSKIGGVPVSKMVELKQKANENNFDEVWIALPFRMEDQIKQVMATLNDCVITIKFVPDIFGFRLINHSVADVAGLPVMNLSRSPMTGVNRVVKAIEDRVIALLVLVMFSPLMMMVAIGVKCSSSGPVFYKQERVGWNGQRFDMLKFRSMPVDVEKNTGPVWAKQGDIRATRFGAFIRRTSLDELPQFINVLFGDMSIVGPRPERSVFVEKFKNEIPGYMQKHLVKAGITGWAQVNGWRGDTDLTKRIEYDLFYIQNWSLWLDIKIMVMTLYTGFINKNAY